MMIQPKKIYFLALAGFFAFAGTPALAQGKNKDQKESEKKEKEYKKEKDDENGNRDRDINDWYENDDRRNQNRKETRTRAGGILGRVILPRAGSASPGN